jgi:hypothetical protein
LGINLAESSTGYPSTIAAYKPTSLFIVRLIAQLEATKKQNAKLLPSGIGLSINVPVTENKGIAFTRLERFTPLDLTFGELPGGGVGLQIFPVSLPLGSIPNPRSEGEQFVSGFTTITPIDGDWSASDAVRVRLSDRLNIQNLLP